MYIRWKTKPRKETYGYDEQGTWKKTPALLYSAYLAESKRVGSSVVQTALYLASIQNWQIRYPQHRAHFWQTAQKKLEALNLPDDVVAVMKTKLEERVPR